MLKIINTVAAILGTISVISVIVFLGIIVFTFAFGEITRDNMDMPFKGTILSLFLVAVFGVIFSITED